MPATLSNPEPLSGPERDRRRGRFVPWVITGFYLCFMSAFIAFVVIAFAHPPQAATENAYEKGLAYNTSLAEAAIQDQMAWRSEITYADGRLVVHLTDHNGAAIGHARARVWFVRPSDSALDRGADLHGDGAGLYSADVSLPARGLWNVHVTAQYQDRHYQTATQIEVP